MNAFHYAQRLGTSTLDSAYQIINESILKAAKKV